MEILCMSNTDYKNYCQVTGSESTMSSSNLTMINNSSICSSPPNPDYVGDFLSQWTNQDAKSNTSPLTICPGDLEKHREQDLTQQIATSSSVQKVDEIANVKDEALMPQYSLSAILDEAELLYGNEKPDFCINEPKDKTRKVKDIATDKPSDLIYRKWRGENYGYWEYAGRDLIHMIAVYRKDGYYAYLGLSSDGPNIKLAVPMPKQILHGSEYHFTNDLRPKSIKQTYPYQTDKKQWAAQKRGVPYQEDGSEHEGDSSHRTRKWSSRKGSDKRNKKSRLTTPAETLVAPDKADHHTTAEATSAEPEIGRVVLRTRFHEAPEAHRPIVLKRQTMQELFSELWQKWNKWLGKRSIEHCVVEFEWLDSKSRMFMFPADAEELQRLRQEARLHLAKFPGECIVDLYIHVAA